ncbi:MAG: hypothetical protein HQL25_06050 [Candidatus Omnitrophica bacterium]|nr:hypothetical protein [Candidatus Omnitrophota bacterium]
MLKRVLSSTIIVPLVIVGLFNKWALLGLVLFFTLGGLYEFFHMAKKKGIPIYDYTGIFSPGQISKNNYAHCIHMDAQHLLVLIV